jgi:hypothetical protein
VVFGYLLLNQLLNIYGLMTFVCMFFFFVLSYYSFYFLLFTIQRDFICKLPTYVVSLMQIVNGKYTGCRKINVFQVGGLVGKNLRNLEKIK